MDFTLSTLRKIRESSNLRKLIQSNFRVQLVVMPVLFVALSIGLITGTILAALDQVEETMQPVYPVIFEQFRDELGSYTTQIANHYDRYLSLTKAQLTGAASYLGKSTSEEFIQLDNQVIQLPEGQYGNPASEATSVFFPKSLPLDEMVLKDINQSRALDLIAPGIMDANPDVIAIFFAAPTHVYRTYPNINLAQLLPADYLVTEQAWYVNGLQVMGSGSPYISTPVKNRFGNELVVTMSMPVNDRSGKLIGVLGMDIKIDAILKGLEEEFRYRSGYYFLINMDGESIYLPPQGYSDILNRKPREREFSSLVLAVEKFSPIINQMKMGRAGVSKVEDEHRTLWIAYAPLPSVHWSLGFVLESDDQTNTAVSFQEKFRDEFKKDIFRKVIPLSIVILVVFAIVGNLITHRIFDPISKLAQAAKRIAARSWDISIPAQAPGEIGLLAGAFSVMKAELQSVLAKLEEKVAERTLALTRQKTQLLTASEVAREVIATRNFDVLLTRTVNLLADRFDYYHVGLFLVDAHSEYVVLRAAPGEIGLALIEQGHRLQINPTSVVGYVASTGESRTVNRVDNEPLHFFNPLLPRTKSELALPLVIKQKVIGVLDVHSAEEAAFDQDDKEVLQTLADQLAIAIDISRLDQEFREAKHQLETLQNQIHQQVWLNVSRSLRTSAYQFDASGLRPISQEELKNDPEDIPYSLPIQVRGETVAFLDVWPMGNSISPSEIKLLELLKDRLSQAVESARLFEETQKRAGRDKAVNEFITNFSSVLDLDSLLQSTVKHFGTLPGISEVEIRIDPGGKPI